MKKLFKLRQWLTLGEAAEYLSMVLDEAVSVADVLRLGLDGHLVISMDFINHAEAKLGKILPFKEVPLLRMPPIGLDFQPGNEELDFPDGMMIDDADEITEETRFVHFEDKVSNIEGIWDLAMMGGERIDLAHRFQQLTGGPPVELVSIDGTFVKRSDGVWASIQSRLDDRLIDTEKGKKKIAGECFPAGGLPEDGRLVVRTKALHDFERASIDRDSVKDAPFLDADAPDYPELLHIALRAWEHARLGKKGTPKQRVLDFLSTRYPALPKGSRDAIAQVANWQRAGGRPPFKARNGG